MRLKDPRPIPHSFKSAKEGMPWPDDMRNNIEGFIYWWAAHLPSAEIRKMLVDFYYQWCLTNETQADFIARVMRHRSVYIKTLPKRQCREIRRNIALGGIYHKGMLYSRGCKEVRGLKFHDKLPDGRVLRVRAIQRHLPVVAKQPQSSRFPD